MTKTTISYVFIFSLLFGMSADISAESIAIFRPYETSVSFPASSGMLDATFGVDGIVTTAPGGGNDVAQAVAIQADGKIVVAGYAFNGTHNDFTVVRYNPNGGLDNTFGPNANGIVMTSVGPQDDEAFGVTIQPDRKIIVVGQASNGINTDIAAVRYNDNGTLDTTFDGDGRMMADVAGANDIARSVAVQPDGRIVIAGNALNGANFDVSLIRVNQDGALDTTFDGNSGIGNGAISTPVGPSNDLGYAVVVQPDSKIIVAGYYSGPASTDTVLIRYNVDGVLDTTFSNDGIATHAFSPVDVDEALAVKLQPDGQIVIAGCIRGNGRVNDYLIARLNSDGSADPNFGTGGFTIVPFSAVPDIAMAVAIQTDGKIVAAGFASNGSNNDFGVTRVNSDGTLDTTFDADGRQQTMVGPGFDSANAIAIQADGKIVVAGRTVIGPTADFGVTRYGYGTNVAGNDGFFDLNPTTTIRFYNAYQAGLSAAMAVNPDVVPPVSGWSFVGTPRMVQTTAQFSGNIWVGIELGQDFDLSRFDAVRVWQYENGAWTDKTASVPLRDIATRTVYAEVSSLGIFAAAAPVAATASVSGRVTTPSGQGLRNVVVTLVDSNNVRRIATTSLIWKL